MSAPETILIGLAGGSASGKSTIARELARCRPDLLAIKHDRYYRNVPDPPRQNYDHPDALESTLLAEHLDRLVAGETVDLPCYDFVTHRRLLRTDRARPAPVILIEGILVLAVPELAERLDLRVYVHAPDDVRLIRRIRRDVEERGRSLVSVLEQYERTVRPMHERFVAPGRDHADLVLDGEAPTAAETQRLLTALRGKSS